MLQSMTAFSTSTAQDQNIIFLWEIRAVNHRFLEISFRMPQEYRCLEQKLRQLINQTVKRGKIECTLSIKHNANQQQALHIDLDQAQQVANAIKQISELSSVATQINPFDLLNWPGVQQQISTNDEQRQQVILTAMQACLQDLSAMKQREGSQLAEFIEQRCQAISEQIVLARQQIPQVLALTRQRILDRLEQLQLETDQERLEQELAYLVLKMDIEEELDRLGAHLKEISQTLTQNQPVGRRLDFLMQELNREANTIGSKSTDIIISRVSVELKVLIEQMREQVQNIE